MEINEKIRKRNQQIKALKAEKQELLKRLDRIENNPNVVLERLRERDPSEVLEFEILIHVPEIDENSTLEEIVDVLLSPKGVIKYPNFGPIEFNSFGELYSIIDQMYKEEYSEVKVYKDGNFRSLSTKQMDCSNAGLQSRLNNRKKITFIEKEKQRLIDEYKEQYSTTEIPKSIEIIAEDTAEDNWIEMNRG